MFRNIVITGASSGIGAGLAGAYAGPGVTLALIGRDAGRLEATAARCRDRGATVEYGILDVCDAAAMEKFLLEFDAAHPVDLVVANAGITESVAPGQVHEPAENARRIFEVNILGALNTTLPLTDAMCRRGHGSIAVLSSLSAWRGVPLIPAYAASKAALKSFFEGIRGRLRRHGVYVTVICPGYIATPMTERLRGLKYPMLTVDTAVRKIVSGIAARKPLVVFPLRLRLALWLVMAMPASLGDRMFGVMFPYRPESRSGAG